MNEEKKIPWTEKEVEDAETRNAELDEEEATMSKEKKAKITAHFSLYREKPGMDNYIGDWEDIPIAVVPPVGAPIILNIGNDVHKLDLEDWQQFHGTVHAVDLYTYNVDGSLLVNIDVVGVVDLEEENK